MFHIDKILLNPTISITIQIALQCDKNELESSLAGKNGGEAGDGR